ncbi:hypothetical protein [Piscinibacter sp. XHJ-5]|uniref:hypothetical protein n=1 Tax=Piscinibacter sp. XHJ-5 TaxID=3037797 RepID=UPI00245346A2|nr:hypothetical protein [Piscinibacter sp. XHJ-5]
MRSAHWLVAAVALSAVASVSAVEGAGLVPPKEAPWPQWQGRLSLGTTSPLFGQDPMNPAGAGVKLSGATLLGDYYFARSLRLGNTGGFRATSGVFLGNRSSSLLSTGATTAFGGRAFSVDRRSLGSFGLTTPSDATQEPGAVPYVGVGYTGLYGKSGWGFSADLGLMALSPASAVKFGRVLSGQNLEDVLRDMRLSPLVQVGVSYSF